MLYREALGEILREERLAQGKTLRKVSKDGLVALGYLSEIERGLKDPSSEILHSVSKALKLPIHDLVIRIGIRLSVPDTIPNITERFDDYSDLVVKL